MSFSEFVFGPLQGHPLEGFLERLVAKNRNAVGPRVPSANSHE